MTAVTISVVGFDLADQMANIPEWILPLGAFVLGFILGGLIVGTIAYERGVTTGQRRGRES